jgi:hypothetical protein
MACDGLNKARLGSMATPLLRMHRMNTWIFSHCISFCFLPIPNFGLCSPTMASFTTLAVFSMGSTAPTARLKDYNNTRSPRRRARAKNVLPRRGRLVSRSGENLNGGNRRCVSRPTDRARTHAPSNHRAAWSRPTRRQRSRLARHRLAGLVRRARRRGGKCTNSLLPNSPRALFRWPRRTPNR